MGVLRLGLIISAFAFVYVTWASWVAGYYPEIAMFRGLLAFMAVGFIGYLGELVVATMPPDEEAEAGEGDLEDESEDETDAGAELAGEGAAEATNIVSLDAARVAREEAREQQGQAA